MRRRGIYLCCLNSKPRSNLSMEKALSPSISHPVALKSCQVSFFVPNYNLTLNNKTTYVRRTMLLCCSSNSSAVSSSTSNGGNTNNMTGLPVKKKRIRYRKQYPGENEGITEEMRFVAMRLRNINGKKVTENSKTDSDTENNGGEGGERDNDEAVAKENGGIGDGETETWKPSMEGFLKYLVDSKLVFDTIERIVDESSDVAYAYFRKTGLERSEGLTKDLEWFSKQGFVIPEPSNPGVSYVTYLEDLAEKSAPLFLSHFYNIYFSHIAGGQVIGRKVSEMLLEGRKLEFYKWEGDVQESLKGVREKLNMLGEHWTRDDRNKCLKEAAKSFKFLGQIIRLIIL